MTLPALESNKTTLPHPPHTGPAERLTCPTAPCSTAPARHQRRPDLDYTTDHMERQSLWPTTPKMRRLHHGGPPLHPVGAAQSVQHIPFTALRPYDDWHSPRSHRHQVPPAATGLRQTTSTHRMGGTRRQKPARFPTMHTRLLRQSHPPTPPRTKRLACCKISHHWVLADLGGRCLRPPRPPRRRCGDR